MVEMLPVHGHVDPRFEPVREAFAEVLTSQPGTAQGESALFWAPRRVRAV